MNTPTPRLLLALLLTAAPAAANIVVDFGAENYTTSGAAFGRTLTNNQLGDFDGDGAADDVRDIIPFSATTALSPSFGWASTATSAIFYGGVQVVKYNATSVTPSGNFTTTLNQNDPTPDRVRIGFNTNTTLTESINLVSGVLLWQKDGFLDGFDTAPAAFTGDPGDGLTLYANNLANARLRWVVRNGDSYYVSASTFSTGFQNDVLWSLNGNSLTSEQWASWDPVSGLGFTGTSFSSTAFNDITAAGFYFESWRSGANLLPSGQNFNVTIDSFVLGASAIPEPSTYGLFAALAALTLAATRRRR